MQNYFSFLLFCDDCQFIQNTETNYTKTFFLMLSKNFFCVQTKVKGSTPPPQPSIWITSPQIYISFAISTLINIFLHFTSIKYRIKAKSKSGGKFISSCLEDYKKKLACFFIRNTFISHEQRQAETWFEITTILVIKKEWRENETFWMKELLSWGKSIIAKKIQTLPIKSKAYPF